MKKKNKQGHGFNKRIFPLMLLMVVPLIMYYQVIEYDKVITNPYYVSAEYYGDIFSFYKSIAIYAVAAFCILFYILYTKESERELRKDRLKFYIPVSVYAVFILLSSIFAIYPKAAWFGVYERYEGALVLISYLIIMIYTIEIVREKREMLFLLYGFLCMTFSVVLIGLLQFAGFDPFTYGFFQRLIGIPETAKVSATFGTMAYSTLYNPNNVGQFTALTIPVTAGILFALKNRGWKIFAAVVLLMDIVLVAGAGSANAIAGLLAAGLFFIVLFGAHLIPRGKTAKIFAAVILVAAVAFLAVFGGTIYRKIVQIPQIQNEIIAFKPEVEGIYFEDITYAPDNIGIHTNKGTYNLHYDDSGITFRDADMNPIAYKQNDKNIIFTEEPYKSIFRITIDTGATLSLYIKRSWGTARLEVVFDQDRFLGLRGTGGRIIREIPKSQMPDRFKGLEPIASRRGYLWFSSIGRLDEVLFIGAGPDNFLYWFDQNDLVGKLNMLHRTNILADKPHSWYIQVATQTGVVSLLALLALLGIFLVTGLKTFGIKRKRDFHELLGSGIVCGVAGYMASALFVDSTVSVTPVFFFLLGIGIICVGAVSEIRRKNRYLGKAK